MKTVEIMQHDDGRVMVGEKPMGAGISPETITPGSDNAGMEHMQDAGSVDEALEMARDLLTRDQGTQDQASFEGGYKNVRSTPDDTDHEYR